MNNFTKFLPNRVQNVLVVTKHLLHGIERKQWHQVFLHVEIPNRLQEFKMAFPRLSVGVYCSYSCNSVSIGIGMLMKEASTHDGEEEGNCSDIADEENAKNALIT